MTATATATPLTASPRADMTALRNLVADDIRRVNQVILEHGHSDIALINDLASHIIAAGGKRLRPSLTVAAAKLCGYEGERHVRLAACVEFIHTATLLHDDVVDESHLRRGAATANALWGNKSSVLVGDFLFSRAFQLMVLDGSLDVLKILSDASAIIASGEVHQLMVSHDLSIDQSVYEKVIAAKTAALFAAASEIGAVVSDKPEWREPLRTYGHSLGMAFQMVDDALDYQSTAEDLGKAIGDDFRDGKVTLPVLLAYQQGTPTERAFWESAIEKGEAITDADLQHATSLLKNHRACERTIEMAHGYVRQALEALAIFPDSPAKEALRQAAEFAVARTH